MTDTAGQSAVPPLAGAVTQPDLMPMSLAVLADMVWASPVTRALWTFIESSIEEALTTVALKPGDWVTAPRQDSPLMATTKSRMTVFDPVVEEQFVVSITLMLGRTPKNDLEVLVSVGLTHSGARVKSPTSHYEGWRHETLGEGLLARIEASLSRYQAALTPDMFRAMAEGMSNALMP